MVLELVVVVIEGELCCKSVVFFRKSFSTGKDGVHAHALTLKSLRDQESGVTLG